MYKSGLNTPVSDSRVIAAVYRASAEACPLPAEVLQTAFGLAFQHHPQARLALARLGGLPTNRPDLFNEVLRRSEFKNPEPTQETAEILGFAAMKLHEDNYTACAALTVSLGIFPSFIRHMPTQHA